MPRPANIIVFIFIRLLHFVTDFKLDYRLSIIGAIAFAFSSYFFIIIQAGHMTKALAIGYLPMVVAAVLYTYRGNMFLGGVLTALTVALQIYCNHLQIIIIALNAINYWSGSVLSSFKKIILLILLRDRRSDYCCFISFRHRFH